MTKKPPVPPKEVRRLTEIERAMAIRAGGGSYADIAYTLGCSEEKARSLVLDGLRRASQRLNEDAELMRTMELERLEALHRALWKPALETKDPKIIKRLLDISTNRARLVGLYQDKPVPADAETNNDAVLRDKLADALARVALQLSAGQQPAGDRKPDPASPRGGRRTRARKAAD